MACKSMCHDRVRQDERKMNEARHIVGSLESREWTQRVWTVEQTRAQVIVDAR